MTGSHSHLVTSAAPQATHTPSPHPWSPWFLPAGPCLLSREPRRAPGNQGAVSVASPRLPRPWCSSPHTSLQKHTTCAHTLTHTHTHTNARMCTNTCMHTHTCMDNSHIRMHMCVYTQGTHECTCTLVHTHTHTRAHTHAHTDCRGQEVGASVSSAHSVLASWPPSSPH